MNRFDRVAVRIEDEAAVVGLGVFGSPAGLSVARVTDFGHAPPPGVHRPPVFDAEAEVYTTSTGMVGRDGRDPEIARLHQPVLLVSRVTEGEPVKTARGFQVGDGYLEMVERAIASSSMTAATS